MKIDSPLIFEIDVGFGVPGESNIVHTAPIACNSSKNGND
jgi:hypothetical protein